MSKGGALVRFHDWRAARDHKAVTRHFWRCRCIGLVAVPVSIGLATLVLPIGRSPFCTRRLHSDRFSARDRFAIAVSIGLMIAPGPLQVIVPSIPNATAGIYPNVMVPAFAVPSSILLHVLSLRQLRRCNR